MDEMIANGMVDSVTVLLLHDDWEV